MRTGLIFAALLAALIFGAAEARADTLVIEPPGHVLQGPVSPGSWHGRGIIFQATDDFSMTALSAHSNINGPTTIRIEVYGVNGDNSRGGLLSSSLYANAADQAGDWVTFAHNQAFSSGTRYEVLYRYEDPQVAYWYYDSFQNTDLNPGNGFQVGTEMLVLDGSDWDHGRSNFWTPHFAIQTGAAVPEPGSLALLGLGLAGLGIASRRRKARAS